MSREIRTALLPHQEAALLKFSRMRVGALFMDMGTGKTLTALSWALRKINAGRARRLIWLCPVSVKLTIRNEMLKHADLDIYVFNDRTRVKTLKSYEVYIIGSESLSSSARVMEAFETLVEDSVLVVDESHMFKRIFADRTKNLLRFAWKASYRMVLTGTPITNGIEDLYSQFTFLSKKILGYERFREFAFYHLSYTDDWPRRIVARHNKDYLMAKITPYTFQVKKSECLNLPGKTYQTYYFDMTTEQRQRYREVKEWILLNVDAFTFGDSTIFKLFSACQQCVSGYYRPPYDELVAIFDSPEQNPRIRTLLQVLDDVPEDEKVVIWCKFRHELHDIAETLGDSVSMFHGEMSESAREDALQAFRTDNRYLVAMTATGGLGIDLTCANYVVFYSNTFKISHRLQAEDRCHRIGQKVSVTYIDISCSDSIDDVILRCRDERMDVIAEFREKLLKIRKITNKKEAARALKKLGDEL